MTLTVSVVLFNNDITEIKKLLSDFFSTTSELYVFIIDNSFKNNSESFKEYKNLEYIYNNENLGYGKAHNIAIRKAIELNSKYHAVVNPDIRLSNNLVDQLIIFMDKNKEIGLSAPKVLYPSGKLQFLCKLIPTPKDLIIRRFSPIKKVVKSRDMKYELRKFDYNSNIDIPYVSGCFMFLRTSVLKKVDGFDERFFLYFEDLDLTRRISELYRTVFFSEAFIYHVYNKESYKNNKVFLYHLVSSIKYFNKWGWIFDKKRKKINKRTLLQVNIKK
jgi:GT2 family glycosyltransferase